MYIQAENGHIYNLHFYESVEIEESTSKINIVVVRHLENRSIKSVVATCFSMKRAMSICKFIAENIENCTSLISMTDHIYYGDDYDDEDEDDVDDEEEDELNLDELFEDDIHSKDTMVKTSKIERIEFDENGSPMIYLKDGSGPIKFFNVKELRLK